MSELPGTLKAACENLRAILDRCRALEAENADLTNRNVALAADLDSVTHDAAQLVYAIRDLSNDIELLGIADSVADNGRPGWIREALIGIDHVPTDTAKRMASKGPDGWIEAALGHEPKPRAVAEERTLKVTVALNDTDRLRMSELAAQVSELKRERDAERARADVATSQLAHLILGAHRK